MTPSQQFKKQMHELIQQVMEEADIFACCLNCRHFTEATELCRLCVPPARPPARTITFGCPAFTEVDAEIKVVPAKKPQFEDFDDDIPF